MKQGQVNTGFDASGVAQKGYRVPTILEAG